MASVMPLCFFKRQFQVIGYGDVFSATVFALTSRRARRLAELDIARHLL